MVSSATRRVLGALPSSVATEPADRTAATASARLLALASSIAGLRVFALSAVLAILAPHGLDLGGTLFEIGVAFAAYALAAALFQIPFGYVADRFGMRVSLLAGLALTIAGSLLAAFATDVRMLGLGRFVAGAGAVNGVATALASASAPEERRTRTLAIFGAAIGASFLLGLVVGPLLGSVAGARVVLLLPAALGLLALVAVFVSRLPHPDAIEPRMRPSIAGLGSLHACGFAVNAALAVVLFSFPLSAEPLLGRAGADRTLALVVLAGGLAMFAFARAADKGYLSLVLVGASLACAAGVAAIVDADAWLILALGGFAFFSGQSALAAALPSAVSRLATKRRASAQSMLALMQSAGTAVGGVAAGALAPFPVALAGAAALTVALAGVAASVLMRDRARPTA